MASLVVASAATSVGKRRSSRPDARASSREASAADGARAQRRGPRDVKAAPKGPMITSDASPAASPYPTTSSAVPNPVTERAREAAAPADVIDLSSGERVSTWWTKGPDLRTSSTRAICANSSPTSTRRPTLTRRTAARVCVCVEYFAGWCFACRSFHPKMTKLAAKEFPDVLFVRVHKDDMPEMCDALG